LDHLDHTIKSWILWLGGVSKTVMIKQTKVVTSEAAICAEPQLPSHEDRCGRTHLAALPQSPHIDGNPRTKQPGAPTAERAKRPVNTGVSHLRARLVEVPYKQEVAGSSPAPPIGEAPCRPRYSAAGAAPAPTRRELWAAEP